MIKTKENKGITLVALVVTIIVLLILAGVAINLTIGNNGLFSRAQNAINVWDESTKKEDNEINDFIDVFDKTVNEININNVSENRKVIINIKGSYTGKFELEAKGDTWTSETALLLRDILINDYDVPINSGNFFDNIGETISFTLAGGGTALSLGDNVVKIGDKINFDEEHTMRIEL